jgi:dTDP-4-dehydrorhamnose 3,5-epimerase-like enzyme
MNPRECKILELPKMTDPRGNLSFVEGGRHIPFEIRRAFYLYDVPSGETRAGHALRKCQQFIIAMSGSFDLVVDYGDRRQRFPLNRSDCGLYVPPMVWREIENFSTNSVCLVLASELYDIRDYVDVYPEFLREVSPGGR